MCHVGRPSRPASILARRSGRQDPVRTEFRRNLRLFSAGTKVPANSAFLGVRCQLPQRLLKTLNRDDGEPVRILLGAWRRSRRPGRGSTSTPARRAPIVFCLMPPIGRTLPSSASSPVAAMRQPCVTFRPSWRAISSANGRPAEGPPTSPRSMSTLNGNSIFASWSTRIPTIGARGLGRACNRTNGDVLRLSVASNGEAHLLARLPPADLVTELGRAFAPVRRRRRRSRPAGRSPSPQGRRTRRW